MSDVSPTAGSLIGHGADLPILRLIRAKRGDVCLNDPGFSWLLLEIRAHF